MAKAITAPRKTLPSPVDHTLIMIDPQSQMAFATKYINKQRTLAPTGVIE